jgi:hypothetical protein
LRQVPTRLALVLLAMCTALACCKPLKAGFL